MTSLYRALTLSLAVAGAPGLAGETVCGWRGDGTGRFPDANPPVEWAEKKNVLWTVEAGPNRYSSPIGIGGKLFVVAEPALLVCVDAKDGKTLWSKENGFDQLPAKIEALEAHGDPGNTTPTPVTDGERVYVSFGVGIVACYDLNGNRQWIQAVEAEGGLAEGRSASPVLAGGRLIVSLGCLMALDKKTGKRMWKQDAAPEGYGTPVVAKIGGADVLVTPSGCAVSAADGRVLVEEMGSTTFASPVVQGDKAYFVGSGAECWQLAKASDGKFSAKKLWENTDLAGTFYASPVVAGGFLYAVSDEGTLFAIDATSGKTVLNKELDIASASGRVGQSSIYSSPCAAGKYIFVFNRSGDALVIEPGKEYKEIRHNQLADGTSGCAWFAGSRLYLRCGESLVCVGK
jgi:outer membrane protein assembly factor BamB